MNKKKTLILSGGGTKGIAHLGAIYVLEKMKIFDSITTYACSSVGSVIGALISVGYSSLELKDIFLNIIFSKMKSP